MKLQVTVKGRLHKVVKSLIMDSGDPYVLAHVKTNEGEIYPITFVKEHARKLQGVNITDSITLKRNISTRTEKGNLYTYLKCYRIE